MTRRSWCGVEDSADPLEAPPVPPCSPTPGSLLLTRACEARGAAEVHPHVGAHAPPVGQDGRVAGEARRALARLHVAGGASMKSILGRKGEPQDGEGKSIIRAGPFRNPGGDF